MEEFRFEKKNIIILSPEKWGKNHISKHHYAKELAKKNKVWFVESCGETKSNQSIVILDSEIQNLTIIKYRQTIKGRRFLPKKIISLLEKKIVGRILKKIGVKIDVVWSFDQFRFLNLNKFDAKIKIFHPVDITNSPSSLKSFIANSSDIIFHVSDYIVEDIQTKKPVYFIQHGLSEEFINPIKIDKPKYILENKINIGYVGNLISKFIDWENLIKAIKENQDVNFIFIGPYKGSNLSSNSLNKNEINILKGLNNVVLAGEMKSNEIASVISYFDFLWLCYDTIKFKKEVSNSHKVIEYISSGRPILSNKILMYNDSDLIIQCNNNSDFGKLVQDAIKNIDKLKTESLSEKRKEFAKKNLYSNKINEIKELINQTIEK